MNDYVLTVVSKLKKGQVVYNLFRKNFLIISLSHIQIELWSLCKNSHENVLRCLPNFATIILSANKLKLTLINFQGHCEK